jgi:hypothetical protein
MHHFTFKIQKFFSGEGTPLPAPHPLDSRAFGARWDPQKSPGYEPEMLLVYQTLSLKN